MEPIKINIEVNLGEATLAALDRLLTACHSAPVEAPAAPVEPTPAPAQKKAKKAAEMPQPEPVQEPAAEEAVEDLPPDDAPDPVKVPTEAEMRAAIQATRKRGVAAKTIREYIHDTFGVDTSVECPESRRQELIDGLAKLAA